MVGKNFQIYSVQITGKYIFWSLAPHVEQFPCKFSPQNLSPYKKSFFEKSLPSLHHERVSQNKTESKRN